jgi:hypothetical protein
LNQATQGVFIRLAILVREITDLVVDVSTGGSAVAVDR